MNTKTKVKLILCGIIAIFFFCIGNRIAVLYEGTAGEDTYSRIGAALSSLSQSITDNPFSVSFDKNPLLYGAAGVALAGILYLGMTVNDDKNKRYNEEYGSARWGRRSDIKPFIDKDKSNNIILTATESLSISPRMKDPSKNRNKNVVVVGSSGSGKTRFYVKPNLMQMHSSYVITDPKGSLIEETGKLLQEKGGYTIKSFNLINYDEGDCYNPFMYIADEMDILSLIDNLITNTEGGSGKVKEDFWVKSERALFCCLFGFVHYHLEPEEQNFASVLRLLAMAEVKEDDEDYKSPLDLLFEDLALEEDTNTFIIEQYGIYKQAAGKTAKSILISAGVRLTPFTMPTLKALTSRDTLELHKIGDRKTALYIIISDTNSSLNFLVAMMYQQLFDVLCRRAKDAGGVLKEQVRFLLDEFANIGKIPGFEKYIATIRSRGMSVNVILQTMAQLNALYDKASETILGNCDTILFLGGNEKSTLKYFSELLGKQTIEVKTYSSAAQGAQGRNTTINRQLVGRELNTTDEIATMDRSECILQISGLRPFKSKKYNIEKHKNYKYLYDYDKSNRFLYVPQLLSDGEEPSQELLKV